MAFIYVTGAPGSGKSTVQQALVNRGYDARDIDSPELGGPYSLETDERTIIPPLHERTPEWFAAHEWRLDRAAFQQLHRQSRTATIIICGVAESDSSVTGLFDRIIYLDLPDDVLTARLANRTGNDYGKNDFERTEILARKARLDTRYAQADVSHVDATQSLHNLVDAIIRAVEA